jgi:2-hydroxy-3-oxopropionate reductase
MRLGLIGLGAMGRPMGLRLLGAGHHLSVFARQPSAAQPLLEAGAIVRDSPADVARASEIVLTIVTADADVSEIALGQRGIIAGAAPGTVLVDMSTVAPATARSVAARLAEGGIDMLDAPVSGGAAAARDGTLAIMVGGEAEVLPRVRPVLEGLGSRIVHVGPNGAGQVAKACNQMIMVAAIEACAEAFALAAASGVDPAQVRTALQGGSAGSRVLDVMGGRMVQGDYADGVEARLHHKDFGILMAEATRLGVPLPLSAQVGQRLNAVMGQGWGQLDTACLLQLFSLVDGVTKS